MYRINEASGALVGIWSNGRLSTEELDYLTVDLQDRIAQHGRIRLLFRTDNLCEWGRAALCRLLRFSRRHEAHIERVAVVGEQDWEPRMRELTVCLAGAEARHFLTRDLGWAWAWLSSDTPNQRDTRWKLQTS